MKRNLLLAGGGAVVIAAALLVWYFAPTVGRGAGAPPKAAALADKLDIPAQAQTDDPGKLAERELAMLESGEAQKDVDREIEKAEALVKKYASDTDEHKMLSRRIVMLKKLRQKMSR